MTDDELLYDAWVVIANAADWALAEDFAGFRYNDEAVLPPRRALPESVEWVEAARRWRDHFHARMRDSDLLHRPPLLVEEPAPPTSKRSRVIWGTHGSASS